MPAQNRLTGGLVGLCLALLLLILPPALQPRAQACGSSGGPTLTTISINGSASDWGTVLANPLQLTKDGQFSPDCTVPPLDRDCQINKNVTGRDLDTFAWTFDSTDIYMYQTRYGSTSNTQTYYFYMDLNANERMNTGEKVMKVEYSGQTRRTDAFLFNYTAVGGAGGDDLVNPSTGYGDGYTIVGTLSSPTTIYTNVTGGFTDGRGFEARVPWTMLGVPAGSAIFFHVSSSNTTNPGQVPASVDDNLAGPGGGSGSFAFLTLSLTPDYSTGVLPGSPTIVDYIHTLTNTGTLSGRANFEAVSSLGFRADLYEDPAGTWMATDNDGDGVWESVSASYDSDTDGRPDSPLLAASGTFQVKLRLTAPLGAVNVQDVTRLRAVATIATGCVDASATDTTAIGDLTLLPSPQAGAAVAGQYADYGLTLTNYNLPDLYDLKVTSSQGFRVDLYTDPNGDGDPSDGVLFATDINGNGVYTDAGDSILVGYDTDSDGLPDFGTIPNGGIRTFVVRLSPPLGTPLGTADASTVLVQGDAFGISATAAIATTVRNRITFSPSYTTANGTNKFSGDNRSVFYAHTLSNNWPAADTVTLSAVSSMGWTVRFYTDPNGDGNPGDGALIGAPVALGANGGTLALVVEVVIPSIPSSSFPVTDITVASATSGLDPATVVSVTDEVRVSYLSIYADSNRTIAKTFFARCDTLYALGASLVPSTTTQYVITYINPLGATMRTQTVPTDASGYALDQYTFTSTDVVGTWTLELRNSGVLVDTLAVTLDPAATPSTISPVTTGQAAYALSGDNLTITSTFNNSSIGADYSATSFKYLVRDPSGATYLQADGTFAAYAPGQFTRVTTPHTVGFSSSATESVTVNTVNFGSPGLYLLRVEWTGFCGNTIATYDGVIPVGTSFASFEDAGSSVPRDDFALSATIYLSGAYYLQSTAYKVAYYDPIGNLFKTQNVASTAGGALSTSILASALGIEGTWKAVVYLAALAPPAVYNPGDLQASASDDFVIDLTPPPAPVVSAPADGSSTNDSTPTVSGTAEANSTVTITIAGPGGPYTFTALTDGLGNWSTSSPALPDGSFSVSATATDAAGNTSAVSNTNSFSVDTAPPAAPVVTAPADGSSTSDTTPGVTGTAEPNSTVTITITGPGGPYTFAAVTDGLGNWSTSAPVLPEGSFSVSATATDAAGNTSPASAPNSFQVFLVNLLRYGGVTQLAPQIPANSAIFIQQYPLDPALDPVRDLEESGFASSDGFANDVSDLGASPPLVFYELEGNSGDTLRVNRAGGKIVITY